MKCKHCSGTKFVTEFGRQLCTECGREHEGFLDLGNHDDAFIWNPTNAKLTSRRVINKTNEEEVLKRNKELEQWKLSK